MTVKKQNFAILITNIKNKKLKNLLTKGPNYKEARIINFSKPCFEIDLALEACIEKISAENNIKTYTLERIYFNYGKKIKKLSKKIQPKQTKQVLCDAEVKLYLKVLYKRFVVVTIVKAANNFAIICKAEVDLSNSKIKIYLKAADPVEGII